jgi:hypothetical protein
VALLPHNEASFRCVGYETDEVENVHQANLRALAVSLISGDNSQQK